MVRLTITRQTKTNITSQRFKFLLIQKAVEKDWKARNSVPTKGGSPKIKLFAMYVTAR